MMSAAMRTAMHSAINEADDEALVFVHHSAGNVLYTNAHNQSLFAFIAQAIGEIECGCGDPGCTIMRRKRALEAALNSRG